MPHAAARSAFYSTRAAARPPKRRAAGATAIQSVAWVELLLIITLIQPGVADAPATAAAAEGGSSGSSSSAASTIPAAVGQDFELQLEPGMYNPSLVVYRGTAYFVARTTRVRHDTTGLKWIVNLAFLCTLPPSDLSAAARCAPFDPWRGNHTECRWGSDTYRVPWEATGVDDTKLFAWPGRGLWAITGRRPAQPPGEKAWCPQPVVWRQFLFQLAREGEDVDVGRWAVAPPDAPPGVRWAEGSPAPALAAAGAAVVQPGGAAGVTAAARQQLQVRAGEVSQLPSLPPALPPPSAPAPGVAGVDGQPPIPKEDHHHQPQQAQQQSKRRLLVNPWAPPWEYPGPSSQPLLASEEQLINVAEDLAKLGAEARKSARRAALSAAHPALLQHLDAEVARQEARRHAADATAAKAAGAEGAAGPAGAAAGGAVKPHQLLIGKPLPHSKRVSSVARPLLGLGDEEDLPGWHEVKTLRASGVLALTDGAALTIRQRRRLAAGGGVGGSD